jgi:hypothetical protein
VKTKYKALYSSRRLRAGKKLETQTSIQSAVNEFTNFHSCTVYLDIIEVLFMSQNDALYIYYIKVNIYIKIYIKIAPTCFGLTTILREHIIDLS